MLYIYQPENFDCGSATDTFWLRLVVINRQILEISWRFSVRELTVLLSAICIAYMIESVKDLDG